MSNVCNMVDLDYLVLWLSELCIIFCSYFNEEVEFVFKFLNLGLFKICFM